MLNTNDPDEKYILVINSGSSSLKFSIFEQAGCKHGLDGNISGLYSEQANVNLASEILNKNYSINQTSHQNAIAELLHILAELKIKEDNIKIIGHRIVHGGDKFKEAILLDQISLKDIELCSELAPLHNPPNIEGVRQLQAAYPNTKQVAVFDTAFHQTLPEKAFLYATPYDWYKNFKVRRFGFHGISYRYINQKCQKLLNLAPNDHQILIAHLGNGCSAAAIINGESVDTTMGLTPLEGLVMGTRSGDVDPSILQYINHKTGLSLDEITSKLNNQSGLLGLSKKTHDMHALLQHEKSGDVQASLAIDVFCFRTARFLGGLATSLQRIDALVFTGGIGEHAHEVRSRIVQHLAIFGLLIEQKNNLDHGKYNNGIISQSDSCPIVVIPTNEQLQIATECLRFLEDD